MNAKLAKKLRKHLTEAEAGQKVTKHAYYELEKRRKTIDELVLNDEGEPVLDSLGQQKVNKVPVSTGQLVNSPGTTRARYQALKKKLFQTVRNRKITKGEANAELRADREFKRIKKLQKKQEVARKERKANYNTIEKMRLARRQARVATESVTAA